MKKNFRYSLCIAALCATSVVSATTIAYLAPRSQGINGARELVGWQLLINRWDACGYYGCFSVTPEYEQTFRSHRITEALFCDALVSDATTEASNGSLCTNGFTVDENCCRKLLIQGSAVTGRNDRALLANYFNMSPFFSSEITFKPKVQNIIVDFNYYQGLDAWAAGLYFRIHAPLVNTRWNLHYCENIIDDGIGQQVRHGLHDGVGVHWPASTASASCASVWK